MSTELELITPDRCRNALLDLAVTGADFVPPRTADPDADPIFLRALARSQEYARQALADGTLDKYASHWRAYLLWCQVNGEDPIGPDASEIVAAHLAWLADGSVDDTGALLIKPDGRPVRAPLLPRTIEGRLAAINKAFELLGLATPGSNRYVRDVTKGIRRSIGAYPRRQRDALEIAELRIVVGHSRVPDPRWLRDLLAVALLSQPEVDSCTQLVRLLWSDIELRETRITIAMPWPTRTRRPRRLVVIHRDGPFAAAYEAVMTLSGADSQGPLFPSPRGNGNRPFSGEGLRRVLRRVLAAAGIEMTGPRRVQLADWEAVRDLLAAPRLVDTRDRAVLLNGFASAARRSNLGGFRWSDSSLASEGLVLRLRRSKTDQEGEGFEALVPYGANEATCPVRHFDAWRAAVEARIGGDPRDLVPEAPIFLRLDGDHGLAYDEDGQLLPMG